LTIPDLRRNRQYMVIDGILAEPGRALVRLSCDSHAYNKKTGQVLACPVYHFLLVVGS
jgi:hypothetical protein